MSTFPSTARAGLAGRLQVPTRLVALALVLAIAAAALTAVLVSSGGRAASPAPSAAVQRQYLGGPGEGAPDMRPGARSQSRSLPANDGSQRFGRRP
jgi:hypothetical protein